MLMMQCVKLSGQVRTESKGGSNCIMQCSTQRAFFRSSRQNTMFQLPLHLKCSGWMVLTDSPSATYMSLHTTVEIAGRKTGCVNTSNLTYFSVVLSTGACKVSGSVTACPVLAMLGTIKTASHGYHGTRPMSWLVNLA